MLENLHGICLRASLELYCFAVPEESLWKKYFIEQFLKLAVGSEFSPKLWEKSVFELLLEIFISNAFVISKFA